MVSPVREGTESQDAGQDGALTDGTGRANATEPSVLDVSASVACKGEVPACVSPVCAPLSLDLLRGDGVRSARPLSGMS